MSQIHEMMAALENKLGKIDGKQTPSHETIVPVSKEPLKETAAPKEPPKEPPAKKMDEPLTKKAPAAATEPKKKEAKKEPLTNEQKGKLDAFTDTEKERLSDLPQKEFTQLMTNSVHVLKSLLTLKTATCLKKASQLSNDHLERLIAITPQAQEFVLSLPSSLMKKSVVLQNSDLEKLMTYNFEPGQLKRVLQIEKINLSKALTWPADFLLRVCRYPSLQRKRLFQLDPKSIDNLSGFSESLCSKMLTLSVKTIAKLVVVDPDAIRKIFTKASSFSRKRSEESNEQKGDSGSGGEDQERPKRRPKKIMDEHQTFANYEKRMVQFFKENPSELEPFQNAFLSDYGITDAAKKGKKKSAQVLYSILEAQFNVKCRGLTDENKKEGRYLPLPNTTDVREELGGTAKVVYVGQANSFPDAKKKASKYALIKSDIVYHAPMPGANNESKNKKSNKKRKLKKESDSDAENDN
jgi:hypothetical protein